VHEVTQNEIAKTLGVTGLAFRSWLRAQKAAGHALLADHAYRTHYRFTPEEAAQLVAEYHQARKPRPPRQACAWPLRPGQNAALS
jgi:hypothetical protein